VNLAANFDRRILVEKAVHAREIECAILGNDNVIGSPVGEVIVGGEFYDFYDKYVNGVSSTQVPADISADVSEKIRDFSVKAYKLLDCCGLARVDSFLDIDTGDIYLNEINTMPGFTSISMYPKMMEEYGMSYESLVDKLIELGIERFLEKQENQIIFDSGSDWYKKG
jgi:D-alanine-D-alanine ligase